MSKAYNEAMKEAVKEYKEWLKERKANRLTDARKTEAIRKATLARHKKLRRG